jgi:predicted DCC family thiol-disulfide oxidoreductase YuxK
MIFDGDCDFCRRWIGRWRDMTGDRIDYAPYQEVADRFPGIPPDDFKKAVQLVEPGGIRSQGAEAVFRSLAHVPYRGWMLWCYSHVPVVRPASEAVYELIASHREAASRATRFFWGDHVGRPEYRVASRIFLRTLGLVYFVAFGSLWTQVDGLIGRGGILPLEHYLDAVRRFNGPERYWLLPTLSWLNAGDAFTHLLCGGGCLVSLLLVLGIAPVPCLVASWALYLSLASDCRDFLGFQWDALLLEVGFLAIFLAPLRLRLGREPESYSRVFLLLLRWLLFRLMFSSGVVKLSSGDAAWRGLTALRYHFETQPLPTWIGWYAHQIPDSLKTVMTAIMFFIELVAPFFIFAPRRLRLASFTLLILLQLAIGFTGNYAFFNLLTIALCLLLLDDAAWPHPWGARAAPLPGRGAPAAPRRWPWWVIVPLGAAVLLITTVAFTRTLSLDIPWPQPLASLYDRARPFRAFNGYGLFAIMTTTRPEIIVEGSDDGDLWLPYEFKWKPGDLRRRPGFVAPHQPRLDWQMWFAALGSYQSNPWFVNFLGRLLQGSPEVLSLLARNPFPDHPPKYIRASLFGYRFTTMRDRSSTGAWWKREFVGPYFPARFLLGRQEPRGQ